MDRYFEIQHFVHPEHPLILKDLKDYKTRGLIEAQKKINWEKQGSESADDVSISCVLCGNEMLDTSYSCIDCDIHLHKVCAKLPTEMMHPSHHDHPLTLTDHHRSFKCKICPKESGSGIEFSSELKNGFSYYCRSCDFDVDVKCASKREAIKHKGHPHPLYPFLRTVLFRCDACGTKHSAVGGVSYMCDTCDFWVHEDCATLPVTVTYHHHVHPLSLVFHRPSFKHIFILLGYCRNCLICKEDILEQWNQKWYYECNGCQHIVHTNCLATTLIAERNNTYEVDADIDLTKLFRLPESFQYDDLVAQMIKHITIHYGGENTALPLISHFSHKHPLTLIHNDDMPSINKREDVLCNACVLPISMPQVYYSCTECNNYALHEWCAKLPNELLQHPAHPHPPILQGPDHEIFGATRYCRACGFDSNGFSYRCDKAACRRFAMDIKCLLPPAILHKAHEHPLKLVENCLKEGCVACPNQSRELAYGCVSCCFYLHNACALKPIAIVHRYDKHHPFTSTSVEPVENRADDDDDRADDDDRSDDDKYVCEFCEEDIDPKWWLHHCLHCDLSACSECIFPKHGGRSHLNPHLTYSSPVHHHPLSCVKLDRTNNTSLCALCQRPIHSSYRICRYALQCAQCKVMFHMYDLDCQSPKSVYPLVLQEGPSCH